MKSRSKPLLLLVCLLLCLLLTGCYRETDPWPAGDMQFAEMPTAEPHKEPSFTAQPAAPTEGPTPIPETVAPTEGPTSIPEPDPVPEEPSNLNG